MGGVTAAIPHDLIYCVWMINTGPSIKCTSIKTRRLRPQCASEEEEVEVTLQTSSASPVLWWSTLRPELRCCCSLCDSGCQKSLTAAVARLQSDWLWLLREHRWDTPHLSVVHCVQMWEGFTCYSHTMIRMTFTCVQKYSDEIIHHCCYPSFTDWADQ